MIYFKDSQNGVHCLDSKAFVQLLPAGSVEITGEEADALRTPTITEAIVAYVAAVQVRLDDFARTRNYDGILSAATYATSTVSKFAAEGQCAVALRDASAPANPVRLPMDGGSVADGPERMV